MDKKLMKSVLEATAVGTTVQVFLRGAPPATRTLFRVRRGRGKHGSLLATLLDENGDKLEIATPRNEEVLGLEVNGVLYGVRTEREAPATYSVDLEAGKILKEKMLAFFPKPNSEPILVAVTSANPELHGIYRVRRGKLEKGRYGQAHLWLENYGLSDGPGDVELWSHRHSTAVSNIELVTFSGTNV